MVNKIVHFTSHHHYFFQYSREEFQLEKQKSSQTLESGVFILNKNEFLQLQQKQELDLNQAIQPKWRYLPFLTIQENLFIQNKNKCDLPIDDLLRLLEFTPTLLAQKKDTLTPLEEIKCQLLQKLLSKKNVILFSDSIDSLAIFEKQQLLTICVKLAQKCQLTIYILSEDIHLLQLKLHY